MRIESFLAVGRIALAAVLAVAAALPVEAAWQETSPLSAGYIMSKTVAGGGYLYKIGGLGTGGICGSSNVQFARLNADGSVGPWAATTPLPGQGTEMVTVTCGGVDYLLSDVVPGWGFEALYANGYVYFLGGNLWNFFSFPDGFRIHFSPAVYYAKAGADGSLGPWQRGADLPAASFYSAGTVSDGVLYLTGGRDDPSTPFVRRDVVVSRLNDDGSPGPWSISPSQMPGGLWLHAAEVASGRLYVSGGVTYDPFPRDQITNGVFSAPLAADGTIGAWSEEAPLPLGLAGHGLRARHGTLYTIGGQEPTLPSVSVHSAAVAVDGGLAAWDSTDPLPVALYLHGTAAAGDSLYVVGGNDLQTPQKATYFLPDTTPPEAVDDLAGDALDSSSLVLRWTATGNDGSHGDIQNGRAIIRYSVNPADFSSFDAIPGSLAVPLNSSPASAQSQLLTGLSAATTYYFAMQVADASGNLSAVSNVSSAMTYFLAASSEVPPLMTIASAQPGLAIPVASTAQVALALRTAHGTLLSSIYEPSPAGLALDPLGIAAMTLGAGADPSDVAIYQYIDAAVGWSSAAVSAQAFDAGAGTISGQIASLSMFALFSSRNPLPVLASLSPTSVTAGAAGMTLLVNGSGLTPDSSVRWNGRDLPTTFVGPGQLSAAVASADIAAAGGVDVTVFNPAPGGGTSDPAVFTVANPVPALASLSPASVTAGGAGLTVTLNGAGFTASSVVGWNGTAKATSFISASQLSVAVSAADLAVAGSVGVSVFNPAPGGGTSGSATFTIDNPVPAIASLSPNSATAGGAAFTLTVNGSEFLPGSRVRWNGADRPATFVNSSRLTAAISVADIAAADSVAVTVVNPAPGGGSSSPATFTVDKPVPPTNPAPMIAAANPDSALAGGAGFNMTVTGSGFTVLSVVRWNGADRATSYVNAGRLTATIPAGDIALPGSASVGVFSPAPGGGTSASVVFTIIDPVPALSSLSPSLATAGGPGFTLTVNGSNFMAGSAVRWNGADRPTTFVSAARLTAAVSAADIASAGSASVSVLNPAPGGGVSGAATFTINNPVPALVSLSPNSATAGAAAFTLTVNGSGFTPSSVVRWNASARTTSFISASQLSAAISAADVAAAGPAGVSVSNPAPGGGTSVAAAFAINGTGPVASGYRVAFTPQTLGLQSNGRFVKAAISGVSGAKASEIDPASVALTSLDGRALAPALRPVSWEAFSPDKCKKDHDDEDKHDDKKDKDDSCDKDHERQGRGADRLELDFDRAALAALLTPGTHTLTIGGLLKDNHAMAASGSLRAIAPENHHSEEASGGKNAPVARHQERFWPAPAALMKLRISGSGDADLESRAKARRGRAVTRERVVVRVPEGAIAPETPLTISTTSAAAEPDRPDRDRETEQRGLIEVSAPVVFGPEGTVFDKPVTIELPYDRRLLPPGTDESTLSVHYWNPRSKEWENLPSTVDRQAQIVRAQTSHFSLYQVLSDPSAPAAVPAAAADFSLRAAYAFPNPARGAGPATIRIQPGLADSVEVNVYDVSGRKIHSSSDFRQSLLGGEYTYDHPWDVSGAGSGVYTYVVVARKAGSADIRKTGRIGVVK